MSDIAISSLKLCSSSLSTDTTAVTAGSGDKLLYMHADANTGRVIHRSAVTVNSKSGSLTNRVVTITQGTPGLTLTGSSTYTVANNATDRSVTIAGTTNAKSIQILPQVRTSVGALSTATGGTSTVTGYYVAGASSYVTSINSESSSVITMGASVIADGQNYGTVYAGATSVTGATITGDPGAAAAYDFSYVVTVPENSADHDCYYYFNITVNGDDVNGAALSPQTLSVEIKAAAAEGFLYVGADTNAKTTTYSTTIGAQAGSTVSFGINSNTSWTIV